MQQSLVLVKIHTRYPPERDECNLPWQGPKVFEERLFPLYEAEKLKDEWVSLSEFHKKDDLCEQCWEKVAPNLCKGCAKYNHICCLCLESINTCSKCYVDDADEFGCFMEVLPDIGDKESETICGYVYFNSMEFEIITDTKIIEAFKIVHPKGYVRSHPVLIELNRPYNKWKGVQLKNAVIGASNYPSYSKLNGIFHSGTGVIYACLNGQMVAIGFNSIQGYRNDGTIRMPTISQLNAFMKDSRHSAANIPLNTKWRNGNNGPVSCDEYLRMTTIT